MDISLFRQKFIEEAFTLLELHEKQLLILEQNPSSANAIDQVYRIIHTLKGSSGMFGYSKISEITHELEELLCKIRDKQLPLSHELVDLLFATNDHIYNLLNDSNLSNTQNIETHQRITQNIDFFIAQSLHIQSNTTHSNIENSTTATWHILFSPDEHITNQHINLSKTFHHLFSLGKYHIHPPAANNNLNQWNIFLTTASTQTNIEETLSQLSDYCKVKKIADFDIFNDHDQIATTEEQLPKITTRIMDKPAQNLPATTAPSIPKITNNQPITYIKVDTLKLDNLTLLVGELMNAKTKLKSALDRNLTNQTYEAAEKIDLITSKLCQSTFNIRLVPLNDITQRFKRAMRDLSRQLGKSVDFIVTGDDIAIDKNIADNLVEPLLHLLRNCIDHGIEAPLERLKRGKSRVAQIRFSAEKRDNTIVIKISDDGRGINTQAIKQKAIEMGLLYQYSSLSHNDLLNLIFNPGLSTSPTINEVSGRGIGMYIVQRKLSEIQADIAIDSTIDIGTTFTITVQQSLNMIDALLVRANNTRYAIPLEDIELIGMAKDINLSINSYELNYQQNPIPIISIRNQALPYHDDRQTGSIVIIKKKSYRYAILTDQIIGEFKVIVKPEQLLHAGKIHIKGSSCDADGNKVLLLDTDKILNPAIGAN
jgi:two-component system chemotaxis sensor kinase CheA